jgi:hypothetical protein
MTARSKRQYGLERLTDNEAFEIANIKKYRIFNDGIRSYVCYRDRAVIVQGNPLHNMSFFRSFAYVSLEESDYFDKISGAQSKVKQFKEWIRTGKNHPSKGGRLILLDPDGRFVNSRLITAIEEP